MFASYNTDLTKGNNTQRRLFIQSCIEFLKLIVLICKMDEEYILNFKSLLIEVDMSYKTTQILPQKCIW